MADLRDITDPEERMLICQCIYELNDGTFLTLHEIAADVDLTYGSVRRFVSLV